MSRLYISSFCCYVHVHTSLYLLQQSVAAGTTWLADRQWRVLPRETYKRKRRHNQLGVCTASLGCMHNLERHRPPVTLRAKPAGETHSSSPRCCYGCSSFPPLNWFLNVCPPTRTESSRTQSCTGLRHAHVLPTRQGRPCAHHQAKKNRLAMTSQNGTSREPRHSD